MWGRGELCVGWFGLGKAGLGLQVAFSDSQLVSPRYVHLHPYPSFLCSRSQVLYRKHDFNWTVLVRPWGKSCPLLGLSFLYLGKYLEKKGVEFSPLKTLSFASGSLSLNEILPEAPCKWDFQNLLFGGGGSCGLAHTMASAWLPWAALNYLLDAASALRSSFKTTGLGHGWIWAVFWNIVLI